jgi:parvulin-like peptidyl-prolyl isomerase
MTRKLAFCLLMLALLLGACRNPTGTPVVPSIAPGLTPTPGDQPPTALNETPTATLPGPTPTPTPLAARVNGEPITLAEYEAELALFQAAYGTNLAPEVARQRVLDSLIAEALLAQAARQAGFISDEAALQTRIDQLGGDQVVAGWAASHGYTEAGFRLALARSAAAAWMRDQIAAEAPQVAEQAHARQILLYNLSDANQALAQLQAGADFAKLAATYNPAGMADDLGWFPRGYLLEPAIESAVFALQPGAYSAVIETRLGFHIVQVVERNPQRPLDPDAYLVLQEGALRAWLEQRRAQSQIEILLP